MLKKRSADKKFCCLACGRGFQTWDGLRIHHARMHTSGYVRLANGEVIGYHDLVIRDATRYGGGHGMVL